MADKKTKVLKKRGPKNRQGLYAIAASYAPEAIKELYTLMTTSRNESVRLGAANSLIDKCLPNLRVTEYTGEDNGPILVKIIEEKQNG